MFHWSCRWYGESSKLGVLNVGNPYIILGSALCLSTRQRKSCLSNLDPKQILCMRVSAQEGLPVFQGFFLPQVILDATSGAFRMQHGTGAQSEKLDRGNLLKQLVVIYTKETWYNPPPVGYFCCLTLGLRFPSHLFSKPGSCPSWILVISHKCVLKATGKQ